MIMKKLLMSKSEKDKEIAFKIIVGLLFSIAVIYFIGYALGSILN